MVSIIFLIVFLFLFNHYEETGLYITLYFPFFKLRTYSSIRPERPFKKRNEKG